jgi:hypothetical protein
MLRLAFPKGEQSRVQIDLARRIGGTSTRQYVKVLNDRTIQGWMKCPPAGGGWGNGDGKANYTVYFYAQFSKPITRDGSDRRLELVLCASWGTWGKAEIGKAES